MICHLSQVTQAAAVNGFVFSE